MSFCMYPDSGEISTIECMQEMCTIAWIIWKKVVWHYFALPAHRSVSTLHRKQNGKLRIGTITNSNSPWSHSYIYLRLLYWPQMVVDGNMKLVHLWMKHLEDNVLLSDGELFMATRGPYHTHIAQAPERQMVSCQKNQQLHSDWSKARNLNVIITGCKTMVAPITII